MQDLITLKIPSKMDYVRIARAFVIDIAKQLALPHVEQYRLQSVIDEVCINVITHAYDYQEDKEILINYIITDDTLVITVKDFGKGFDPSDMENLSFDDFTDLTVEGGRGIFLVKELMDEVEIKSGFGEGTEVRLTKYLINRKEAVFEEWQGF